MPFEQYCTETFGEKRAWAYPGAAQFVSTYYYLRYGRSYQLLILYALSYNTSPQKPINNFRKSSQGLSKLSRASICMVHRVVTFVIAWLSCYLVVTSFIVSANQIVFFMFVGWLLYVVLIINLKFMHFFLKCW